MLGLVEAFPLTKGLCSVVGSGRLDGAATSAAAARLSRCSPRGSNGDGSVRLQPQTIRASKEPAARAEPRAVHRFRELRFQVMGRFKVVFNSRPRAFVAVPESVSKRGRIIEIAAGE